MKRKFNPIVTDPGHGYTLHYLDDGSEGQSQSLTFVKRYGAKYPFNSNSYPGTTLQSVLRCLHERVVYLQMQVWCPENVVILYLLKVIIWLLEFRGCRRHGKFYFKSLRFALKAPMCPHCGHTFCDKINL